MNIGQGNKSAKNLTEEIDRATDVAVGAGLTENQALSEISGGLVRGNVTSTQAQALGRGAIFGRGEAGVPIDRKGEAFDETTFGNATDEALVGAAVELSEVENEINNPEAFVGVNSQLEVEEYRQRDEEVAEDEADPRRSRVAKIEFRNQEAVAKVIEPKVKELTRGAKFELRNLSDLYREGRDEALKIINHPIGARN